ncbi:MAG: hypothetical protein JW837_03875 [Sedimentisphaerales bacterium]|nr:hypothetical protein [Sedimentisphaerales bacterium]
MNAKTLLLFGLICTIFSIGQQACYGMDQVRQEQQQVREDFKEIKARQESLPKISRELLKLTETPIERPSSTFIRIRDGINRLSNAEEIRPEQVEALRTDLNEAIENTQSDKERTEYEKMREKLGIVQSIAGLKERERKLIEIAEKSQKNFDQLDEKEAKVSLWKDIFSGGFTVSFIANMIALLGFITKMPGTKLDRQLKLLQIAEKKAQLEKDGIDYKHYI